ncbi:MAG: hypothetical protein JO163_14350 [Methylobacteriaceae bacterium]|nr:hypothetical protein [Methylobacteriaceae bacterium]
MRRTALWLTALAAALVFALPGAAEAQNTRSWVSGTGNDAQPCSRTQPCLTFGGAFAKTNAGGEINCLDSADFGVVSITRAVTIDCTGVEAAVEGVNVNAGATDVVTLRGLDFDGQGISANGAVFLNGAALHIENCVFRDYNGASEGFGIAFTPNASAELFVSDTVLTHNGSAFDGGAVLVRAQVGDVTKAIFNRVDAQDNFFGFKAQGTGSSGAVINMTIRDSVSAGNRSNGIVGTTSAGGAAIVMMIDRSTSSHNAAGFGVIADGPETTIRIGNMSIAGNINGVGVSNGGVLQSYGTNQINGNSSDGIASLTPIGLH